MLENIYQHVNDTNIYTSLDLFLSTCCDIRKHPACLFANSSLRMVDDFTQAIYESTINNKLSLIIVTCKDITDGTEAWDHDWDSLMLEQLN